MCAVTTFLFIGRCPFLRNRNRGGRARAKISGAAIELAPPEIHLPAVDLHLTVVSKSELLLQLVGDFARGLGCAVGGDDGSSLLRIDVSDADDGLLELLDYVALSAARAGVDVGEPLCRLTYRRGEAAAQVTLDLRIADFSLGNARADTTPIRPGPA
jgi:hypothetical protein